MNTPVTYIILLVTCAVSLLTMQNNDVKMRYMFNAYAVDKNREWWRFFTHGFLHANFPHLLFNMFSLYFFGVAVEAAFRSPYLFGPGLGTFYYILLYFGGLFVSCIYTFFKQRDNMHYNALGASGAVSAVIYTSILLSPATSIYIYGAIGIPAWLYGGLFLLLSWFMARNNVGNIGHDAHFWGAVYGFVLPILLKPSLFSWFVEQLHNYFSYTAG